jgi:hypothetical protein
MSVRTIARSISRPVQERLRGRPFAARVLAVFEHACDLVTPAGDVVALVTPQVGDGPLNIVVEKRPGVFATVEPGGRARLDGGRLQIGGLEVALEGAAVWEPCPDWAALRARRATVVARLPLLQAISLHHSPAGSLLPLVSGWLSGLISPLGVGSKPVGRPASAGESPVKRGVRHSLPPYLTQAPPVETESAFAALSAVVRGAAEALRAGWEGDHARLREGAAGLAGLGGGLTPAGDDFLSGAMLSAWLVHPTPRALCHILVEAAVPRTTTLSAAFLRAAAEGECNAPWHRLLAALGMGAEGELAAAVPQVLAYGAASGADTLAGFLWAGFPFLGGLC